MILYQRYLIIVLVLSSIFFSPAFSRKKIWKSGNNFEWKELQCYDSVKFEPNFYSVIKGPQNGILINNALELPNEGMVLLEKNSVIAFQSNSKTIPTVNCNRTNNLLLTRNSLKPWFSPENWIVIDPEQEYNRATPDNEKIPCSNDAVEFPADKIINIDLQFVDKIEVQSIKYGDEWSQDNIEEFLSTKTGQMMFTNEEDTVISTSNCDSDRNCPCPVNTPLCFNMENYCPTSRCVDPIQPSGFCCKICGAFIHFTVGVKRLDLKGTSNKIKEILKTNSNSFSEESIEYYVSLVDELSAQIVIVDKEDYGENSPKAAEFLKKNFIDLKYPNRTINFMKSGSAYEPISDKNIFAFIFLPLLIILTIFAVLYAYHYETTIVPRFLAMRIRQINPNDFVFARFDNRRESVATVAPGAELNVPVREAIEEEEASGFHNPMFDTPLKQSSVGTNAEEGAEKVEDTNFVNVDLLGPAEE